MKALHYSSKGLRQGLPIEVFAKALKEAAKGNPKATLNDVMDRVLFFWDPRLGPGTATIETEGKEPEILAMPIKPGRTRKSGAVMIQAPCVLRLAPEQGAGLVVNVAASGSFTISQGAEATPAPVLDDTQETDPMRKAALQWLRDGRVGLSSYALCVGITGVTDPQRREPGPMDIPYDSSDFHRCMAFFKAVPQARKEIVRMHQCGAYWQALAHVWDELEQLHDEDKGKALSERLEQIRDTTKAQI